MNVWQALFSKRKTLSPRKRRKKRQTFGWKGWAIVVAAVVIGGALAIGLAFTGQAGKPILPGGATEPDAPAQEAGP